MKIPANELVLKRREEIIDACENLYQTMDFRDINLKEISKITSFSRPTIYNYFQSKEDILLALTTREYERWNAELTSILEGNTGLTQEELADKLARSLEHRSQLLKLLSAVGIVMEGSSREELLSFFKTSFGYSFDLVARILDKFCPWMPHPQDEYFILTFFSLMFGINSYVEMSENQKDIMETIGVDFMYQTIYSLSYNCILGLLRASDINFNPNPEGESMLQTKVNSILDFRKVPIQHWRETMTESELQDEMANEIKKDLLSARVFSDADTAEAGDVAELRLISNRPKFNRESVKINLGLGLFNKELESGIIGHSKEDDFHVIVDRNIVKVTILSLKRRVSAELNDDFARSLGIEGIRTKEDYLAHVREKFISLFSDAYLEYHAMDVFDEMIAQSDIEYSDADLKLFMRYSDSEEGSADYEFEKEDAMFLLNLYLTDCINRGIDYHTSEIKLDSKELEELKNRVLQPIKEYISGNCEFMITEDE